MIRILVFACCLLVNAPAFAQAKLVAQPLKTTQLPTGIKYRGKLYEAWQWKDQLGDNILLLSSTSPVQNATGTTVELFAYHFYKKDTGYRTLWRVNDLVKDCPLDYEASFLKGATTVTDLDMDGIAETSVQYKLACRGDVGPSYMKLIMHEDSVKYALRGSMWLRDEEGAKFEVTESNVNLDKLPKPKEEDYHRVYGRYETEKDFAKAPPAFLQQARKQWLKFAKESD
jgi:hypothetical protein